MLILRVFNICHSNEKLTKPALAALFSLALASGMAQADQKPAQSAVHSGAPLACGVPEPGARDTPPAPPVHIESVDIHLELRLRNGRKIRLKGLEPPRGTPANPGLAEEARLALAGWVAGETAQSTSVQGEPDRWGRHEASLFLPGPGPGAPWLHAAGHLIAHGWGRVDPAGLPADCVKWLYLQEQSARAAALGLWSDPHYRVIDAANPGDLSAHGGQIVLIEGLVSSVGTLRTLSFVNLGPRRGRDPALVVSRRIAGEMERAGVKLATLTGQRIRARGVLQIIDEQVTDENRRSPRIEIMSALAVETMVAGGSRREPGD